MSRTDVFNAPPIVASATRTWWGRSWLMAAAGTVDLSGVIAKRARDLVRDGGVTGLQLAPGAITASVRTERKRVPRTIELPVYTESQIDAVADVIASQVRFIGDMMNGAFAPQLTPLLVEAEAALFVPADDLTTNSSSADPGSVGCLLAAAAAIDADPFALFMLRGLDEETLLRRVREARSGAVASLAAESDDAAAGPINDRPVDVAGDLLAIPVQPRPPSNPGQWLEQLGELPIVKDTQPLQGLIAQASDVAWKLAAGEGADAADDAVLLSELRAQRMATPHALSAALGWDTDVIVARLDALYADGAVLKTGTGEKTKYRAV